MRLTTAIIATLAAGAANAQFNLKITEIWPGNEQGNNLTSGWFEPTNTGVSDFVVGVDGFLFHAARARRPGGVFSGPPGGRAPRVRRSP